MATGSIEFKVSKDSENVYEISYVIVRDELECWHVDKINGSSVDSLEGQQYLDANWGWKVEDACWDDYRGR